MSRLSEALAEHRAGHALPRAFTVDPDIYAEELDAIWSRSWLCAGSAAQAPAPGDFFRFDLDRYSLVLVRDSRGDLHAVHNTCRHRGMPFCQTSAGKVRRWVCPYHQWSYRLDGSLLSCGGMEAELAGEDHGLFRAAVAEIGGLVFVCLGADPGSIDDAAAELEAALAPQGLTLARVAQEREYDVRANWKLVWENNRECWHCHAGHPQYVKANFDIAQETEETRVVMSARAQDHARALGGTAAVDPMSPGLYSFPGPGQWWSANRTALAPGFVTESVDGKPVSRLMGDYADYDVGTLRVRTVPNFWCHASSDHAVLTWLVPDGPQRTRITVQWLVDRDAVEGHDYTLSRLLPFWQLTSEQDWSLCEQNQRGVSNPAFVPGPYSSEREYNVLAFVQWYLERMTERCDRPSTSGRAR